MQFVFCTDSNLNSVLKEQSVCIKLKMKSFKSSDDFKEEEDGPYRGFGK